MGKYQCQNYITKTQLNKDNSITFYQDTDKYI